ncbi:MAG: hypothetical protein M0Z67_14380 [Nitrospiraceae bacterium]|nr:hypothetical protein [Nitrospiraceae bacterium]
MKEFLKRLETIFTAVAFTEAGELEKASQCMAHAVALSPACGQGEIIPGQRMPLVPEGDS